MRAKQINVGEGWMFAGLAPGATWTPSRMFAAYPPRPGDARGGGPRPDPADPEALERAGYEMFVNPYGRVFIRAPQARGLERAS